MKLSRVPLLYLPVVLAAGCGPHSASPPAGSAPSLPPAKVTTITVSPQSHQSTEEVVGTVRSKLRAVIEAKVSGRVLLYLVSPGQVVKEGELLAELDGREVQARLDQAAAILDQADKELMRYKQLVAGNAVSRQEFDAVEARQKVAKAAVAEAETMLGYAKVTSPFAGVITRKLADVGDLAMPGKPLMEIEAAGSLRFEADLPEAILDRVSLGSKMRVRTASAAAPLEAIVSEIAPVADPVSRTFQVKFDLPSSDSLRTGQFGRVSVPVGETEVLLVPRDAIVKRGQMEIVFVVRDSRAALRLVKTGRALGDQLEILSGLEPGETVVTSQTADLQDGQPIETKP